MKRFNEFAFLSGAMVLAMTLDIAAQTQAEPAPEDSFSLEAAILDTSIPFAVGAHEARQELRGAFGWPTFQEGLVEGVYFRFDPDGYARFSPTPRLDTDVFEVICRPRTHVCMARKGPMNITLSSKNQVQLEMENVTDADRFSIIDGISELQLPANILQPLDSRMEILLSAGGDLLISRSQKEVDRVSLSGFAAVISYLRWVSAQQDYNVLPRDWPIPNAVKASPSAALTQSAAWASPMPQPAFANDFANGPERNPDVADVQSELRALREILFDKPMVSQSADNQAGPTDDALFEMRQTLAMLAEEVAELRAERAVEETASIPEEGQHQTALSQGPVSAEMSLTAMNKPQRIGQKDGHELAVHLDYLISEIGLDPAAAIAILQPELRPDLEPSSAEAISATQAFMDTQPSALGSELHQSQARLAQMADPEYLLLSDYFKSVFETQ